MEFYKRKTVAEVSMAAWQRQHFFEEIEKVQEFDRTLVSASEIS
jgi:hypothetical protein